MQEDSRDTNAQGYVVEAPYIKHPLHNEWVLWYDGSDGKRVSQDRWFQSMKKISAFASVEDFWGIFNNIRPPSRLTPGSNYHLFKKGIQPMWEDETNQNGGKWTYAIPKKQKESVDEIWMKLVLALIGENFDEGEEICGAVVSIRQKQDRVAVWTRHYEHRDACLSIGHQLKQFLDLSQGQQIGYVAHSESIKRQAQFSHSLYEI